MGLPTAATEVVDRSLLEDRQPSVGHLFRHRVHESADSPAYQYFEGEYLVEITWREAYDRVSVWAAGLLALGLEPEDRVAIVSHTRLEWVLADLAIMCAGGATTTVYPNTIADDVAYLLRDSGCRIVLAENAEQVEKLRADPGVRDRVVRVVSMDPRAADGDWVISTDDLFDIGSQLLTRDPGAIERRIDGLVPGQLATIIYTSGTTGRPKGVELTHDAFVYVAASAASFGLMRTDDLQFLWLPLSHVFGKVLLTIPLQIGFPTAIDGRIDRIVDNLQVIRPTMMGAAPRIFEKVKAKVGMTLAEESGVKASLISWAFSVGSKVARAREAGKPVGVPLRLQHQLADRLVLAKVRDRFGGRLRLFISGAAPLDPDVARWFATLGLLVCEGYGLTETSAFTAVNRAEPGAYRFGSIGWAAPGTEMRIAQDGEVLVRGPGVMRGYHNQPEATAAVLTEDGWFHTGDVGEIDERGFVRITDRKKDFFKTSGGKYVAHRGSRPSSRAYAPTSASSSSLARARTMPPPS
ncbi:MAG: AMP-binding protein [Dermatophilaceae bacterium]